jgi:hypothetical protein
MAGMLLVGVTVAAAVVVGWLRGGRLRNLGAVSLRRPWLLAVSVGAQLMLAAVARAGGPAEALALPLLVASQVALAGFLLANLGLPGILLVTAGAVANAAVILANGAMPVSRAALLAVSPRAVDFEPAKHRLLSDGDRLSWLADVIPLPLLRTVVSAGDVVLAAGVAVLVAGLMRDDPPAQRWRGSPRASSIA